MLKIQSCADSSITAHLGGLFCAQKRVVGFYLFRKGLRFDASTFNKTELDNLITSGKAIGMVEFYSAEDNDQDADYATSVSKIRVKTIEGVKGFTFTFDKGSCFQNQLNKLDGTDWDFVPVLEGVEGYVSMANYGSGKVGGFASRLFVGVKKLQLTADIAGSTLMIDILPQGMKYWQGSSSNYAGTDFNFSEVSAIEGVSIEVGATLAGTTVKFSITGTCNGNPIVGLDDKDEYLFVKDGIESALTNLTSDGNGNYTATVGAVSASNKISIKFAESVYILDESYYAVSSSNTVTVTGS